MSQNWYRPHPYGVYPRGNTTAPEEITHRFGTLSVLVLSPTSSDQEHTELTYLELMEKLMCFMEVSDLCRLSRVCTGCNTWKETAIRGYFLRRQHGEAGTTSPIVEVAAFNGPSTLSQLHQPVLLRRRYFCDLLFQAWMCTLLPSFYHLHPTYAVSAKRRKESKASRGRVRLKDEVSQAAANSPTALPLFQQYSFSFNPVERCAGLFPCEFRKRFEEPNIPVVLTGLATQWPLFKILSCDFKNLSAKKHQLVRDGCSPETPLRCEHTSMSLDDYVRYATTQHDERPIYMFDAEFGDLLDIERLYSVPPHFSRDDFFASLGPARRPKYRWLIAGAARTGSNFHVDPNYTNAWNANLTGRKRWLLFPPGATPPGVIPSKDMSEVATPVSLTEWLLNYYDAAVQQLRQVGYECICEPGDIMFVPCGWWHYVINLEDSVAITQNYVCECNLPKVIKFLRTMPGSISGINEDADDATAAVAAEQRRRTFVEDFLAAMRQHHPEAFQFSEDQLQREHDDRMRRRVNSITLLPETSEGFRFAF